MQARPALTPPRAVVAVLALLILACGGCMNTAAVAPQPVRFVENNPAFTEAYARLLSAYETEVARDASTVQARLARDRLIFLLRIEIDRWYAQLEQELHHSRATFNSWGDFLELGMAGAGAIADPVNTKTAWATLLSVTKGTRLSIDKNWFREKATESLINAMRTGRNQQLAQILKKMAANNVVAYTYEEAWGDLITYHQAGTLQGGLVLLAATTGEQAKKAEEKVDEANTSRYPALVHATPAMIDETAKARADAQGLSAEKKRAALAELRVGIPAEASDEAVADLLLAEVQSLATATPERRRQIIEAINRQAKP